MIGNVVALERAPLSVMLTPGTCRASAARSVAPVFASCVGLTTEMLYGTSSVVCERRLAVTITS